MQMAFQMCLRIALRAPLMLICSMVMCLLISAKLSIIFLAAIIVLACALAFIMSKAMKIFSQVFRGYDDLNARVQENISAIRVVKAFVREDYESEKFNKAATALYDLLEKAEKLQALSMPIMMFVVYGCLIAISWFGAHFIVAGDMTAGNLTSLFSYVMTALSSLMMLSMIFVMMTMSMASGRRIAKFLKEQASISAPDDNAAALAGYSDQGRVADYVRGAVGGLVQLGLLPVSNNRLSPAADLTRADMALLLHRAMTQ